MISVCFAHLCLLESIVVLLGPVLAVCSAMEAAAERFLLRSVCDVGVAMDLPNVSINCTHALPRAMCGSLFF